MNKLLLFLACLISTVLTVHLIGEFNPNQIEHWLQQAGIWAPIIYILLYIFATVLVLPSTALNLAGGAVFGPWFGTFWTSIAAVIAAVVTFIFTRTIGRNLVTQKLIKRWRTIDTEIKSGGFFYIFAIRLLPIIPYGLVNFAAGLTSIRFRDYFWGTLLGTVPGVAPFVLIGSSGSEALRTGNFSTLIAALSLTGVLSMAAIWYRRHRGF